MLAANLHQLRSDLRSSVGQEADQERCRQLLANVEFVQAQTAPLNSMLYSNLYRLVAWLLLAGFPVATLILVQISSLRYQSDGLNWTQRVCLGLDLILLVWFFYRQRRRRELSEYTARFGWIRYLTPGVLALVAITLNVMYLNVPRRNEQNVVGTDAGARWSQIYKQPLDLGLCPTLHWGCRYLSLDHRTLVAHVWDPRAIADLQTQQPGDVSKPLAAIDGVFVHARRLRFANFSESRLYGVHMGGTDLTGANLARAQMIGANLSGANLSRSLLFHANLTGAILNGADLTDAVLIEANLSNVDMSQAAITAKSSVGQSVRVTQAQLDQACANSAPKFPADRPLTVVDTCPR